LILLVTDASRRVVQLIVLYRFRNKCHTNRIVKNTNYALHADGHSAEATSTCSISK